MMSLILHHEAQAPSPERSSIPVTRASPSYPPSFSSSSSAESERENTTTGGWSWWRRSRPNLMQPKHHNSGFDMPLTPVAANKFFGTPETTEPHQLTAIPDLTEEEEEDERQRDKETADEQEEDGYTYYPQPPPERAGFQFMRSFSLWRKTTQIDSVSELKSYASVA